MPRLLSAINEAVFPFGLIYLCAIKPRLGKKTNL
jgi:hypothetical protein